MNIEVQVDHGTANEWRTLAAGFADHNIYQTWSFGEASAEETSSQVSRAVVRRDDVALGMAQLRIKRIPVIRAGLAYVYWGPLWRRPGASPADFEMVLRALHDQYAVGHGLSVRIVPNLLAAPPDSGLASAFDHAGYVIDSAAAPYRTFMLDLSPPLEELRSRLTQRWRRGLNQSEKRGLTIHAADDDASMAQFEELYDAMWERKQFETGVTVRSFRTIQAALDATEKQTVLLALLNGEVVAGHVSSTLGDTCVYLLGASNEKGRETKASFLLHWKTVETAKARGVRWYDLGGIDPEKNPGGYDFKVGLGGADVTFVGQYGAPASGPGRYLIPLAERAYRALAPLRRSTPAKLAEET